MARRITPKRITPLPVVPMLLEEEPPPPVILDNVTPVDALLSLAINITGYVRVDILRTIATTLGIKPYREQNIVTAFFCYRLQQEKIDFVYKSKQYGPKKRVFFTQ